MKELRSKEEQEKIINLWKFSSLFMSYRFKSIDEAKEIVKLCFVLCSEYNAVEYMELNRKNTISPYEHMFHNCGKYL